MSSLLTEQSRGWTGIIDPSVAFIVVEQGRITDVIFSDTGPSTVYGLYRQWKPEAVAGYTGPTLSGVNGPTGSN